MYGEQHPFRLGLPAAASLAVNALLAAALLSIGLAGTERKVRSPAMTTLALAAVKGTEEGEEEAETAEAAKPVPPAPAAALPPPPPLSISPRAMPAAPTTEPRLPALPAAATAPATQPAQNAAPSAAPPQAATPASPAPAATTARRGKADGLDVRAPSGDGRSYASRIRSWLYAHKIYPRRSRMRREEGVVQVRFTIDRGGVLLDGAVVRGSGNGALDEEAMATLRRSSPFPAAPREISGDRIEFTVPIEFALAT